MSLISDFKDNPKSFLEKYVVVVPEATDAAVTAPKVSTFKLSLLAKNVVYLEDEKPEAAESISAYYLPWEKSKATTMDLADKADFFFTSEMTNCRFSILVDDAKTPKVAHVAGTIVGSLKRNTAEKESGFVDDDSFARARRLSISDGRDKKPWKKPKVPKKHEYRGQDTADKSSAFVYGLRKEGNWNFYAQIAKGVMTSGGALANKPDADIEILGYVDL